ncbi:hypothetical protein [Rhizobium sp. C1]|uniref:hypothetical protein n=1 Tax=Rhizobium sp. C1 TaxID=1349799 RepID=UPI001E31944B|nr:hypothetical protein [Rhizobium sp. C1]MCD2177335.1 hypothetical protein [Rhizobium sp. C1]
MRNFVFQALILTVAGPSIVSAQSQCDFDKPTGKCVGTVSIQKSYGSKPSFGAELSVRSSAAYCSKVEFYVDSTPYQTVLKNSSHDIESVFGTKPISRKNIAVKGCTSYASVGQGRSNSSEQVQSGSFSGTWSGSIRWTFVSAGTTLSITEHGNSVSGTWTDSKAGGTLPFNGTRNGSTMTFQYVAPGDGSHGTATMVLLDNGRATFTAAAGAIVFSGTLSKH